jgi:hypothetical protein
MVLISHYSSAIEFKWGTAKPWGGQPSEPAQKRCETEYVLSDPSRSETERDQTGHDEAHPRWL